MTEPESNDAVAEVPAEVVTTDAVVETPAEAVVETPAEAVAETPAAEAAAE